MQRDVAFKIVYFFILFIIGTFGLLYAYFKMSKKESLEDQRKARAKGIFFGEPSQQTFFDFLSGQNDPESSFSSDTPAFVKTTAKANEEQRMESSSGFGEHNIQNIYERQ